MTAETSSDVLHDSADIARAADAIRRVRVALDAVHLAELETEDAARATDELIPVIESRAAQMGRDLGDEGTRALLHELLDECIETSDAAIAAREQADAIHRVALDAEDAWARVAATIGRRSVERDEIRALTNYAHVAEQLAVTAESARVSALDEFETARTLIPETAADLDAAFERAKRAKELEELVESGDMKAVSTIPSEAFEAAFFERLEELGGDASVVDEAPRVAAVGSLSWALAYAAGAFCAGWLFDSIDAARCAGKSWRASRKELRDLEAHLRTSNAAPAPTAFAEHEPREVDPEAVAEVPRQPRGSEAEIEVRVVTLGPNGQRGKARGWQAVCEIDGKRRRLPAHAVRVLEWFGAGGTGKWPEGLQKETRRLLKDCPDRLRKALRDLGHPDDLTRYVLVDPERQLRDIETREKPSRETMPVVARRGVRQISAAS